MLIECYAPALRAVCQLLPFVLSPGPIIFAAMMPRAISAMLTPDAADADACRLRLRLLRFFRVFADADAA